MGQTETGRAHLLWTNRAGRLNINFNANWICREEPESPVWQRGLVVTPKLFAAPGTNGCATRPGCPKLAWLKTSKNSARNCTRVVSDSFVFLMTEKSVLLKPGPIITLRPRL